ncbi:uncharacterized protein LOC123880762 [Maniola jurtina]|uniref:uncharacterized protein LOC123880762 n=1 Tax=Maniola jurtina TaxID=191418 RepID=UPI001E68A974|nr:uncharacterized protein LOC123880762 [Maniola jurtina]XP_045785018.1 uncharacterized protein LOC123880762 [Maniola jurtina]XP_045785020.1 uncharacterized protein LOC123880762 [Maniola jurtina]XP_045785021.1 uncharacterized protein LOC123880762 [Maniola jurtina]
MAKELTVTRYDPNTEAFQMRAQWKKVENCKMQWAERWSWLLDERKIAQREADAVRQETAAVLPHVMGKSESQKSLKPVPITSTGIIGWLAAKPDCQLEIYTSWITKIPPRLPNAWDNKNYV